MCGLLACFAIYAVLSILLPGAHSSNNKYIQDNVNSNDNIQKRLEDLSHQFNELNLTSINILETLRKNQETNRVDFSNLKNAFEISEQCSDALYLLAGSLAAEETWAFSIIDASSVLTSGLLAGNLVDMGAYDLCVDQSSGDDETPFDGQHCMVTMTVSSSDFGGSSVLSAVGSSLSYTFTLCLPSTCPATWLNASFATIAQDFNHRGSSSFNISFNVPDSACHTKTKTPWSISEILGISVTLLVVALTVIATIIEMVISKWSTEQSNIEPTSKVQLLVRTFSALSNGKKLMSTTKNDENIEVLHSLKFMCIAWVAVGHRFKLSVQSPLVNMLKVADYIKEYSSMLLLNAPLSVDVFFIISGILNTYSYLNTSSRSSKTILGHILGYVHRYIRLTPAFALMILVTATWLYRIGDGPLWDQLVGRARKECTNYWWLGLLYLNNYIQPNYQSCMFQSWYLSADMQMFWLSPLVLYSLWRWPKIGLLKLFVLGVLSIIVSFLVAYFYQIKAPIPFSFDTAYVQKVMMVFYFPTHTKTVSYIMGMFGGYVLHLVKRKKMNFKIHYAINLAVWVVALALIVWSLFGGYSFFQLDSTYNRWESSLYIAFFRFAWSIGVVWLIVACSTNHGGYVQTFFCWSGWAPLGRLTYCIYLTHAAVILYSLGSLREPQYFSYYTMCLQFGGEFIIAIVLALVLTLTVEAPVLGLEKILGFRPRSDRRPPRKSSTSSGDAVKERQGVINLPHVLSSST